MLRLLAFDGIAGSGKDAIAEGLIKSMGFTKVAFATAMKQVFSKVFDTPLYYFEVRALKDSPFPLPIVLNSEHLNRLFEELKNRGICIEEAQVKACQTFIGTKLHSPRDLMQIVGTNIVRNNIDRLTWIKLWDIEQRKYEKVIAPDARFSDEREYVRQIHGKVLLVKREGISVMSHVSENDKWTDDKYDAIIYNDVSLPRIQSEVAMWYTIIK